MALTHTDCMAAASAVLFLGLLGGESALVLEERGFVSDSTMHCDASAAVDSEDARVASEPCAVLIAAHAEAAFVEAARERRLAHRDENPFIDSGAKQAYLAEASAAPRPRVAAEREAAATQTDTDLENR